MSGRRKRGRRQAGAGQAPAAQEPLRTGPKATRPATRTIAFTVAGALVVAAIVALALMRRGGSDDAGTRIAFPAERQAPPVPPAFTDYAGAESCEACHADVYAEWSASTHGRAGGDPGNVALLAAFDGRPIRFADATVTPRRADGAWLFVIDRPERAAETVRVDGVVGGGHMVGGGTQGFVSRQPDGTLRFLPFEMIRREGVWFCNTDTRLGEGWQPITPSLALADCGDWPPVRVLGSIPRYASCQECHGSRIDVEPALGQPYATRVASLAIDCESCHGPGGRHIAVMKSGAADTASDIGMTALATVDKDPSLAVCFRCHALKDQLRPDYLAGAPVGSFYSVKLPLLSGEPILPDGRVRTFAYQQGHLYSDCYLSGSMTCVDCHEPHSQRYRDANGAPLPGRFDDGQCTACHASKAVEPARHTHHAPGSEGSRCVSCHMPYLQEGDVGTALRYARSDHTIPIPRPSFDAGLGIEPACQSCHRDRTVAALQATVDTWYGETKPHPPLVAALSKLRAGPDADVMRTLIESRGSKHAMADFTALAAILQREISADMPSLDDDIEGRFRDAATSDDPDIAALALASLHYARGSDRDTRRFLAARLDSLGGEEDRVRSRWVVLLGFLADGQREAGDARAAIATYGKALEIRPEDPRVLVNLGLAYAAAGDLLAAEQAYMKALGNGPEDPLTLVNLGIARAARGDGVGAVQAYRRASEVNPSDPLPYFNLGNLYLRAQRVDEAIEQYRRAVAADEGLAPARFNLGRALAAMGSFDEAAFQVREGLKFDRSNPDARELLAQIEAARVSSGGSR